MQKADAEKMLLQCASGTFLIRFSEGEPGGISVAWVTGELTMDNVDCVVTRQRVAGGGGWVRTIEFSIIGSVCIILW